MVSPASGVKVGCLFHNQRRSEAIRGDQERENKGETHIPKLCDLGLCGESFLEGGLLFLEIDNVEVQRCGLFKVHKEPLYSLHFNTLDPLGNRLCV